MKTRYKRFLALLLMFFRLRLAAKPFYVMIRFMKKIVIFAVFTLFLAISGSFVYAHELQKAVLPNPGLVPGNPFYFLDRIGETIKEFFTFNQEDKAKLQLEFASERVAEIKIILETKGVDAPGLEVAQAALQANIEKASNIVESEQNRGNDVKKLAGELDDGFSLQKQALTEIFHDQKDALKAEQDKLKTEIETARDKDNQELASSLAEQLLQIKEKRENFNLKQNEIEERLEEQGGNLEMKLSLDVRADKAITEAEEKLNELAEEVQEHNNENPLDIPPDTFAKFNNLLNQAKDLYAKGNFQAAYELAANAVKSLKAIKNVIEEPEKIIGESKEELPEIRGEENDSAFENHQQSSSGTEERRSGISCVSDSECGGGFSCWNRIPAGPAKGVRGSKENPGTCFKNDLLEKIF